MVVQGYKPEESVVHNIVNVLSERRFSGKRDKRSLFDILIKKQISVYKQTLISVRAPDPAISLDSV